MALEAAVVTRHRILIVEDDAEMRLLLDALLRKNGYETRFALDAAAAMLEARREQPDLILLDLGLPAGGGFVVLDRLRSNTRLAAVPVIVVSGRDQQANEQRALDAGARAYVRKPWDDDELLALIRVQL